MANDNRRPSKRQPLIQPQHAVRDVRSSGPRSSQMTFRDVLPCESMPEVAAVCGCTRRNVIRSIHEGRKVCPLGAPWGCPYETAPYL